MTVTNQPKFEEGIYAFDELLYRTYGRFDKETSLFYPLVHIFKKNSSDELFWYAENVDGELQFVFPVSDVRPREPFLIDMDAANDKEEAYQIGLVYEEDEFDQFMDDYINRYIQDGRSFRVYNKHLHKPLSELN